jgi:hypothetical protein
MSSVVIEKPPATPDAMASIGTPSKTRIRRYATGVATMTLACLKWLLRALHITDGRTPTEKRMAEKERQKEVRRELRGLPPTPQRDK